VVTFDPLRKVNGSGSNEFKGSATLAGNVGHVAGDVGVVGVDGAVPLAVDTDVIMVVGGGDGGGGDGGVVDGAGGGVAVTGMHWE